MGEPKYLLIKGRCGLGNRMLAGVTGILYAQMCGRTPVFDWRDRFYSHDGTNAFAHLFDCRVAGSLDDLPDTDSVAPAVWRGRLDGDVREMELEHRGKRARAGFRRHSCVDISRVDHPEQVAVMWAYSQRTQWLRPRLEGALADLRLDELLRLLLREHLHPREEIAERVAEFRREHLRGPTVGVHVRWSDRRSRLEAIEHRLERLTREQPGLKVFLATDNSDIHARFARRMEVIATPRWYPPPGRRMHRSEECPDLLEHAREALVDMHLLAGCDHLIGDFSSSFVLIAGLLSDAPRSNVVDVNPVTRPRVRIIDELWRRTCRTPLARPAMAYARLRGVP